MGEYLNSGKQVMHRNFEEGGQAPLTHIADAGDNEKAHFLATAANAFDASREAAANIMADEPLALLPAYDYISEARVTLSPSWHGEKVSRANFVERLNAAIDAANRLDMVKKTLFYGRDNNLDGALGQANLRGLPHMIGGDGTPALAANVESNVNIIHGIIGAFTEAGELLEAMRTAINSGQPFDKVNLKEEVGDLFWYLAVIAHECGFNFEGAQRVNIAKLRARFPDAFTEHDANNRNLGVERQVLEAGVPRDIAEQALPAHYRTRRMDGERNLDGNAIEAQKPTS